MYPDGIPAKKRKTDLKQKILEVPENKDNPPQCPVKLYNFYLSKWLVALFIWRSLFVRSKIYKLLSYKKKNVVW